MFNLIDGKKYFWQWDANQRLITTTLPVGTEVHFYHDKDKDLKFKGVIEQEGTKRFCKVPDDLLKCAGTIQVYAYSVENPMARTVSPASMGNYTVGRKKFTIKPRPEPVK